MKDKDYPLITATPENDNADAPEGYGSHMEHYRRAARRKQVRLASDIVVKPSVESIIDHAEVALFESLSRLSRKAASAEGLDGPEASTLTKLIDSLTKISREGRLRAQQLEDEVGGMKEDQLRRQAAGAFSKEELLQLLEDYEEDE